MPTPQNTYTDPKLENQQIYTESDDDGRNENMEKSMPNPPNSSPDHLIPDRQRCQRLQTALLLTAREGLEKGISTPESRDFLERNGMYYSDKERIARAKTNLDHCLDTWRKSKGLGEQPIVWINISHHSVLFDENPCSMSLITALGIDGEGRKQILAAEIMPYTDKNAWKDFFLSLKQRGVSDIGCLVADASLGLPKALQEVFPKATWQYCTIAFINAVMKNVYGQRKVIRHFLGEIFQQPTPELARKRAEALLRILARQAPDAATFLRNHLTDGLQFHGFTKALAPNKCRCTSLLRGIVDRIHQDSRIPCLIPSQNALIRIYAAALMEMDDDWKKRRAIVNPDRAGKIFLPWIFPDESLQEKTTETDKKAKT